MPTKHQKLLARDLTWPLGCRGKQSKEEGLEVKESEKKGELTRSAIAGIIQVSEQSHNTSDGEFCNAASSGWVSCRKLVWILFSTLIQIWSCTANSVRCLKTALYLCYLKAPSIFDIILNRKLQDNALYLYTVDVNVLSPEQKIPDPAQCPPSNRSKHLKGFEASETQI